MGALIFPPTQRKDPIMEMFAKVFESHGRQVLVTKGEDSDGNPQLKVTMRFDGAEMSVGPCFSDDEAGEAALDNAFDKFGQEQADVFAGLVEGAETPFQAAAKLGMMRE